MFQRLAFCWVRADPGTMNWTVHVSSVIPDLSDNVREKTASFMTVR